MGCEDPDVKVKIKLILNFSFPSTVSAEMDGGRNNNQKTVNAHTTSTERGGGREGYKSNILNSDASLSLS